MQLIFLTISVCFQLVSIYLSFNDKYNPLLWWTSSIALLAYIFMSFDPEFKFKFSNAVVIVLFLLSYTNNVILLSRGKQ